jgi:hypothetical protein
MHRQIVVRVRPDVMLLVTLPVGIDVNHITLPVSGGVHDLVQRIGLTSSSTRSRTDCQTITNSPPRSRADEGIGQRVARPPADRADQDREARPPIHAA